MRSRFESLFQNLAFRSALLATLFILAAFFVIRPDVHGHFTEYASHEAHEAAQHGEQEKIFFGLSPEGWTALFTAGLFFATLALFVATYALFDTAARESDKADEALEIAKVSAEASRISANVARDTLVAAHRAWIKIDEVRVMQALDLQEDGAGTIVQARFTNVGNAIANFIWFEGWLMAAPNSWVADTSLAAVHQQRCLEAKSSLGTLTLFPGESFPDLNHEGGGRGVTVDERCSLARGAMQRWDGNVATLFLGGSVTYQFPSDDRIHQTTFHFWIGHAARPFSPVLLGTEIPLNHVRVGPARGYLGPQMQAYID